MASNYYSGVLNIEKTPEKNHLIEIDKHKTGWQREKELYHHQEFILELDCPMRYPV